MKFKLPKRYSSTILMKLVIYFVLIIGITLAGTSFFLYSYFSSSFKDEITSLNDRVLNQLSTFSDEFILKNSNQLLINMIMYDVKNTSIESYLSRPHEVNPQNTWEEIIDIQEKIDNVISRNRDIVDSIYVYSKVKNQVISEKVVKNITEVSSDPSDEFYWIDAISRSNNSLLWVNTRNTRSYSSPSGNRNIITLVCTYPASSNPKTAKGFFAVNINEEALNSYLVNFNSTKLGQLLIIDNSGAIISHSDKSSLYSKISGERFVKEIITSDKPMSFTCDFEKIEYMVSFNKSNYNNWYYVSMIPKKLLYQKDYLIRQRIFVVSASILFIVLILSNIFSYKIYAPLKRLLEKYGRFSNNPGDDMNSNEYIILDSIFNKMSGTIHDLQETLDKNMLMIRHNFLNELLKKQSTNIPDLHNTLDSIGVNFCKEFFSVIVFMVNKSVIESIGQKNIQFSRYTIIDYIKGMNDDNNHYYPIDADSSSIIVIVNSQTDNVNHLKSFVNSIEVFCYSSFNFYLIAGLGRIEKDISEIHNSSIEAKMSLKYKFIYPEQNIFCYDDITCKNINGASIPLDFTDKFERSLNLGYIEEIRTSIEKFTAFIFSNAVTYTDIRKEICLYTSIFKQYLKDMNIDFESTFDCQEKRKLLLPDSINEFFDTLNKAIGKSFACIAHKKLNKNSQLIIDVEGYVAINLSGDLSLNTVAEKFRITPQYLSKIFKDEKGINYIDCVTKYKIEKAKQLLCTSGLNVDEIAENIGYSHSTYFSRKFKELVGCTPGEFRSKEAKKLIMSPTPEQNHCF